MSKLMLPSLRTLEIRAMESKVGSGMCLNAQWCKWVKEEKGEGVETRSRCVGGRLCYCDTGFEESAQS